MRGHDREHRARPRRERRAAVEAEPADPQQPRADDRQRQIERREILAAKALSLADHQRRDQPGDAGVDVHDGSAGEVQQTHLLQEAAAPHPMRRRNIDDEQPHRAKQHEGRKLHALGDRAADQRASNDREGHLIGHEQYFRDSLGERTDRLDPDPHQGDAREIAEISAVAGEGQAVAEQPPQDRHERGGDEALRHGRENVLLPDHAAVKQREPRQRHHQHQRGGGDHEAGVGGVDLVGGGVLRLRGQAGEGGATKRGEGRKGFSHGVWLERCGG